MIVTKLSMDYNDDWTGVSIAASLLGGFILLFLLIWASIKLITRKDVPEMAERSRFIVESISRLLFLYWIYLTVGPIIAIVWAAFILWDGIRSVRQLSRSNFFEKSANLNQE